MGIVNVTPDSFSDGGRFFDADAAVAHALQLVADGADLLDIGGESTRPYSEPVPADEELRRVLPVIEQLVGRSADSDFDRHEQGRRRPRGDRGRRRDHQRRDRPDGRSGDGRRWPSKPASACARCTCRARRKRCRIIRRTPTSSPKCATICASGATRSIAAGIARERICLDPGIGFGKTHEHNITLMRHCYEFHALGCPLLVGHSRKGFLGKLIGDKEADRTNATVGVALGLAVQGVQILRVHDVRPVREALLAFEATGGLIADRRSGVNALRPDAGLWRKPTLTQVLILPILNGFDAARPAVCQQYVHGHRHRARSRQVLRRRCRRARSGRLRAWRRLRPSVKNDWLRRSAQLLREHDERIIEANARDLAAAPGYGLTDAAIDRLRLTASGSRRSPSGWSRSPSCPTRSAR